MTPVSTALFFTFVKAAVCSAALILPVSLVLVVVYPSAAISITM